MNVRRDTSSLVLHVYCTRTGQKNCPHGQCKERNAKRWTEVHLQSKIKLSKDLNMVLFSICSQWQQYKMTIGRKFNGQRQTHREDRASGYIVNS